MKIRFADFRAPKQDTEMAVSGREGERILSIETVYRYRVEIMDGQAVKVSDPWVRVWWVNDEVS